MHADEIADTLRKHLREQTGIVAVYLFGSHASAAARPQSDVDVAILFAASVTNVLAAQLEFEQEIGRIPGLERVEVVALNLAPLRLQAEVLETGLRVWCPDEEARVAFEFDTMRRWWDMESWRAMYDREYFALIKDNFTDEQRRAYQRARQTLAAAG